jgi:hypothetical protein
MGVRPGQNLFLGETWQVADVADAAALGQELGQGRAARQPSEAVSQGRVDVDPLLVKVAQDVPVLATGPAAGPIEVTFRPGQDLFYRQRLEAAAAAPTNVARHGVESKRRRCRR